MAEWLRRWTANPLGSPRVGSNPILVGNFFFRYATFWSVNDVAQSRMSEFLLIFFLLHINLSLSLLKKLGPPLPRKLKKFAINHAKQCKPEIPKGAGLLWSFLDYIDLKMKRYVLR